MVDKQITYRGKNPITQSTAFLTNSVIGLYLCIVRVGHPLLLTDFANAPQC